MRRLALLLVLLLPRPMFACDLPSGFPVTEPRFTAACGNNHGAIALTDHGGLAAWHWFHAGFGTVTSLNYGIPVDAIGRPARDTQQTLTGDVYTPGFSAGGGFPQIATDGDDFLVTTYAIGTTAVIPVKADGTPGKRTDVTSIVRIPEGAHDGTGMSVWTGSDYLLGTTEVLEIHDRVSVASVSRGGDVGALHVVQDNASLLAMAPAGSGKTMAIWRHDAAIESALVDANGLVSTPQVIPGVTSPAVSLATNGVSFALAIPGAYINLTENTRVELEAMATAPKIVWDRDAYVIVWNDAAQNIRAIRVAGNGAAPAVTVGHGTVESIAASPGGVVVVYSEGCGSIHSQLIGSSPSLLSVIPSTQGNAKIIATPAGHQLFWLESGNTLYTRFIGGNGGSSDVVMIGTGSVLPYAAAAFQNGTAVVWWDGDAMHIQRFDSEGHAVGAARPIEAMPLVVIIRVAAAGDEILVATWGERDSFKFEVDAARLDANGETLQTARLSNPVEDGFDIQAAGDAERWIVGWRNGGAPLIAIEMPHGDVRQQTRTVLAVEPKDRRNATLMGIVAGANPALVWYDNNDIHTTFIHSQQDVALTHVDAIDVRVRGDEVFWTERNTGRILSAPLASAPARERACVGSAFAYDYDFRGSEIDAIVYTLNDSRVRVTMRPAPRRRSVVK